MNSKIVQKLTKQIFNSLKPADPMPFSVAKLRLIGSKMFVEDMLPKHVSNASFSGEQLNQIRHWINDGMNYYKTPSFLNTATKYGNLSNRQAEKLGQFLKENAVKTPIYNKVLKKEDAQGATFSNDFKDLSGKKSFGIQAYAFNVLKPSIAIHEGHHAAMLNIGELSPLIYGHLDPDIKVGMKALVNNNKLQRLKAVENLTPEGEALRINNPKSFNYLFDPEGFEQRSRINTAKTLGYTADNVPEEIDYAKKYIKPEVYKDIFKAIFATAPIGVLLFNKNKTNQNNNE